MWVKERTEFKYEILSNIKENALKDRLNQTQLEIDILFFIYHQIGEQTMMLHRKKRHRQSVMVGSTRYVMCDMAWQ